MPEKRCPYAGVLHCWYEIILGLLEFDMNLYIYIKTFVSIMRLRGCSAAVARPLCTSRTFLRKAQGSSPCYSIFLLLCSIPRPSFFLKKNKGLTEEQWALALYKKPRKPLWLSLGYSYNQVFKFSIRAAVALIGYKPGPLISISWELPTFKTNLRQIFGIGNEEKIASLTYDNAPPPPTMLQSCSKDMLQSLIGETKHSWSYSMMDWKTA